MRIINKNYLVSFALTMTALLATGCPQPDSSSTAKSTSANSSGSSSSSSGSSSSSISTSTITALQIITKADLTTGSFDSIATPAAGGAYARVQRLFALDGSRIAPANIPAWFSDAQIFLTSTRTAGTANPNSPSTSNTPCAYFDGYSDNNPDSSGFYTVDGYNATASTSGVSTDIDQCAGTAAAEQNKIGLYFSFDRRFMNPTDKLQIIIKAKPIEEPNTGPTASSCVVAGNFNAANCSNQLFTVSLRTAPGAATRPFYILFPSAKALDLLSESILLPINVDTSISTVSIDRVKGGAVIYGVTVIRLY